MDNVEERSASMTPAEFVGTLFRICLGRTPDPEGLVTWTEVIRSTRDPTLVLKGILGSAEYQAVSQSNSTDCSAEVQRALSEISRRPRVVDVGAQSLGAGTHPYDPLLAATAVDVIGFDPLEERLRERSETETPAGRLTLLPYAIGDGGTYTLHINNEDSTSSLFPLNEPFTAMFNHLSGLRTVRTESIKTHRLDDVLPPGPIDFLKLDVQGAELLVLDGAAEILTRTAVVHCEVSFSSMYKNQSLFPDVHRRLMERGFSMIDIVIPSRYHYNVPSGRIAQDRLIWADAVFLRDTDDAETRRMQALIAASVYRKPTLSEHLLTNSR